MVPILVEQIGLQSDDGRGIASAPAHVALFATPSDDEGVGALDILLPTGEPCVLQSSCELRVFQEVNHLQDGLLGLSR